MKTNVKTPILSAIAFFGTLGVLSVGYSAYVSSYPASATAGVTQLSATEWNKMVSALQTLDTNLSAFTVSSGNVGIWNVPSEKLDVTGTVKTSVGVAFPDGNTQTKAFQGIMSIRQNNIGSFTLAHGASATYTATCQAGEIATGGGCQDGGYKDFYYWQPGTNSYSCGWYNTSGGSRTYAGAMVHVNCLK